MSKRNLFVLVLFALASLFLFGCDENGQPVDPELCTNPLYNQYDSQACTNVRANRNVAPTLDECRNAFLAAYVTIECINMRDANPPEIDYVAPDTCTTCGTATSGGHVMDPSNVIQDAVMAMQCSNPQDPMYYDQSCLEWQIANP